MEKSLFGIGELRYTEPKEMLQLSKTGIQEINNLGCQFAEVLILDKEVEERISMDTIILNVHCQVPVMWLDELSILDDFVPENLRAASRDEDALHILVHALQPASRRGVRVGVGKVLLRNAFHNLACPVEAGLAGQEVAFAFAVGLEDLISGVVDPGPWAHKVGAGERGGELELRDAWEGV